MKSCSAGSISSSMFREALAGFLMGEQVSWLLVPLDCCISYNCGLWQALNACMHLTPAWNKLSAVAEASCCLVPPSVAFRMHTALCHLQAGWLLSTLLGIALVVWHLAPLPAVVFVLRAMSTISALMQQVDELLHLAHAEAAAAQRGSQELHALRQWAAAQGTRLPAFTGGALWFGCMLWVRSWPGLLQRTWQGYTEQEELDCVGGAIDLHCQAAAHQAEFTEFYFLVVTGNTTDPSLCYAYLCCFSAAGIPSLPQAIEAGMIGCLQGMKESLRVSKGRTQPQGRQSKGSTLQLASLQTGQGSWSRTCYVPCTRPGHLTLMPGEGLQLEPKAFGYRQCMTCSLERVVQGAARQVRAAPAAVQGAARQVRAASASADPRQACTVLVSCNWQVSTILCRLLMRC